MGTPTPIKSRKSRRPRAPVLAESMNKTDWLVKFRRAKTEETLDVMLDGAINKAKSGAEIADIVLAHEARQKELLNSSASFKFCD